MFADRVALSFERPTPSHANVDRSWSSFAEVYRSLFVGGSSKGKERERKVIVLDDDEEEEMEPKEAVGGGEVPQGSEEEPEEALEVSSTCFRLSLHPAADLTRPHIFLQVPWVDSGQRSLSVNLSWFQLTSLNNGKNDFPRPARCTIRVSVIQTVSRDPRFFPSHLGAERVLIF